MTDCLTQEAIRLSEDVWQYIIEKLINNEMQEVGALIRQMIIKYY